ncbi:MAG: hypothetical protein JWN71_3217 [Xanthobacteraceae bacterium]|nr:hypothetical protein [Xanthobacteraceae bacterium]
MIVAGGCYRELCEHPYWNETFGSGGRAAAAIASYSNEVRLQTYFRSANHFDLYTLQVHGVTVEAAPRDQDITFAYLHPLGEPHRLPQSIVMCDDIRAAGRSVLRFGFVEGGAIVDAGQAVYDPQSATPALFSANGSRADRLAIVLNQAELQVLSRCSDMTDAAQRLLRDERAEAIIVKCGARGAWVYETASEPQFVPAFRSKRVFKIGTGDVFSGIFAYHWCERRENALQAAIAASQAAAFYAETRSLKIAIRDREPVRSSKGRVSVVSFGDTLPDRWLREEARSALIGMGAELVEQPSSPLNADAVIDSFLILADGNARSSLKFIRQARSAGVPTVVYKEKGRLPTSESAESFYSNDFSTAIYNALWAAPPRPGQYAPQT